MHIYEQDVFFALENNNEIFVKLLLECIHQDTAQQIKEEKLDEQLNELDREKAVKRSPIIPLENSIKEYMGRKSEVEKKISELEQENEKDLTDDATARLTSMRYSGEKLKAMVTEEINTIKNDPDYKRSLASQRQEHEHEIIKLSGMINKKEAEIQRLKSNGELNNVTEKYIVTRNRKIALIDIYNEHIEQYCNKLLKDLKDNPAIFPERYRGIDEIEQKKLLKEAAGKVNISAVDEQKNTLLHISMSKNNMQITTFLLNHGAAKYLVTPNIKGFKPCDYIEGDMAILVLKHIQEFSKEPTVLPFVRKIALQGWVDEQGLLCENIIKNMENHEKTINNNQQLQSLIKNLITVFKQKQEKNPINIISFIEVEIKKARTSISGISFSADKRHLHTCLENIEKEVGTFKEKYQDLCTLTIQEMVANDHDKDELDKLRENYAPLIVAKEKRMIVTHWKNLVENRKKTELAIKVLEKIGELRQAI